MHRLIFAPPGCEACPALPFGNMDKKTLLELFGRHPHAGALHGMLGDHQGAVRLKGLRGSAPAFLLTLMHRAADQPAVVVLPDREEAAYFHHDLVSLGGPHAMLFPPSFKKPWSYNQPDNNSILHRAETLSRISRARGPFTVVTSAEAIHEQVITRGSLSRNTMEARTGESLTIDFLSGFLDESGFERTDFVFEPGQYAVRGGIVDIFSFASELPYRLEFNGDTVGSIRSFEPQTQLSEKQLQFVTILPNIRERTGSSESTPFFGFIPEGAVCWLRDFKLCTELIRAHEEQAGKPARDDEEDRVRGVFETADHLVASVEKFQRFEFGERPMYEPQRVFEFRQQPQPSFNKNFDLLAGDLAAHKSGRYDNVILCDTAKQAERIFNIFDDLAKKETGPVRRFEAADLFSSLVLSVHEGFIDTDLKLACYTDHQVFDRYHRYRLRKHFSRNEALTLKDLYALKPGDYVTHIDHGVGKFAGLEKIVVRDREQEAIRLVYKDNDILYISIHSLHRIARFTGKEGKAPALNKLGSPAWATLKQRTKKKVKDIARDLIMLYARRKAQKGFAYAPDSYLQTELEASFIYEDTPDQLKATQDVKSDMEIPSPMDRLICGDVGFGKTEIAIRAAFKAATDGKQVAMLVPTTILAMQHYRTFSERLAEFPCTVDYINRFKSTAQQKKSLDALQKGKTEIIIGTHRLLSKDIRFRDLGLLIVDEEQKFGVSAKEKIKALRTNVDTLTLTATPIPRTLQFSLMGARDLSIINTPPPNRFPVTTELHVFREEIFREAIDYEISRGGQVFFIHNRIQDIQDMAAMLRKLCPQARIVVGHGQMEGAALERVMMSFINGEADVLVSTTIVESGLDISNANTILINQAQHFGLSDLHQMRGRVGRANKKAFCYLITPPLSVLSPDARQRMQAIEEFSDLGSGFNIAMRDLDIRGAGNLLGGEQSGFISEIGFETYHKILDEAMTELKEQDFKDLFKRDDREGATEFVRDCQVETDLEILIPTEYVESSAERLSLYRELDEIQDEQSLQRFAAALEDRFGPVPRPVTELLDTVRLRRDARQAGFEKMVLKNGRMKGWFVSPSGSAFYKSAVFAAVIEFVKMPEAGCTLREERGRLALAVPGIRSIREAEAFIGRLRRHVLAPGISAKTGA